MNKPLHVVPHAKILRLLSDLMKATRPYCEFRMNKCRVCGGHWGTGAEPKHEPGCQWLAVKEELKKL